MPHSSEDANFNHARFSQYANFAHVEFSNVATFFNTTFSAWTDFNNTTCKKNLYMRESVFKKAPQFYGAKVEGEIIFPRNILNAFQDTKGDGAQEAATRS